MSLERPSFQSVFQEITQTRPPERERRAQPGRGQQEPSVPATEHVLGALGPQEHEDRELQERRPPGGPARARRSANHPAADEEGGRPAHWAFDSWPFPFASFWTSLAAMALCSWGGSLIVILAAMGVGVWAGVVLDHWLRKHPRPAWPWVRAVLGVMPPAKAAPATPAPPRKP